MVMLKWVELNLIARIPERCAMYVGFFLSKCSSICIVVPHCKSPALSSSLVCKFTVLNIIFR
jgi:hypothetical protein